MLQLFRNILGSIVTIFYARNKRYVCIFLSAWLWFVIIAGRSFFVCVFFSFSLSSWESNNDSTY